MKQIENSEKIQCINCKSKMIKQSFNNVELDYCLKCQSIWFDKGELESVLGSNNSHKLMELSSSSKLTKTNCPKCCSYLHQIELIQGSGVIVEICHKCDGFFLDKGELQKLKEFIKLNNIKLVDNKLKYPKINKTIAIPSSKTYKPVDVYMFDVDSFPVKVFQFVTGCPIEKTPANSYLTPVTGTLIILNVIIFLFTYFSGGLEKWIPVLGMVPNDIVNGKNLITILTSMFTHGGWFHLLGNMYFLFVTGDDVENVMGSFYFLLFYLAGGVFADLGQIIITSTSTIPHIGASGAIAALMGAYMIFLPKRKFFFRIFYFLWFNFKFEVPVYGYIIFWFLMQLLNIFVETKGVAWWTHISGLFFGIFIAILIRVFKSKSDISIE